MTELRIVRHTDRFDECCHFYGELLGWPVTRSWDGPEPGRIFGYGDTARIEVIRAAADAVVPVAGVFVSVEVDDVAAIHDRFVAAGVSIDQPITVQPWGHRNVAVTDPAGMTVVCFEVIA